jgi:dihydroorotase
MNALTITRPDDWHLHLRDGDMLAAVAPDTARQFARAIVMPNLDPPVTTTEQAIAYRRRILDVVPGELNFDPLMTLYLTDETSPAEIGIDPCVHAVKWYPAGATTNSSRGVSDISCCYEVLEAMQQHDVPLLVHGEVTDADVDVFDREQLFIERYLIPVTERFPGLRVVLEHVTTSQGVEFVKASSDRIAATITAHHLLLNRNALFAGGLRPHHYCLPVLKREQHRRALVEAATSGNPKFFLGTDSAPHAKSAKESGCGCAGMYTALAAIDLYAEVFDEAGALDRLQAFASFYGADFYGLPRNSDTITLQRQEWRVPDVLAFDHAELVPFRAGEMMQWKLAG